MSVRTLSVLAALLVAATACGNSRPGPDTAASSAAPAAPSATPAAAAELPHGYDPRRDATADIAAALANAKAGHRPVLLDVGADWCPDCVVLGRTFRTRTVRPVIDGFHVVAIDVGRFDRHVALARKYHLDLHRSGIPALVVLSPSGKVRTETNDGSFANARTMPAEQVAAFLKRWR